MAETQVDVSQLPLPQLNEIKQQMEQEMQVLTGSFGTLKTALAKFNASGQSVATLSPENADKQILVPLTESLYVPAKLASVSSVIVDVGTGYYTEQSVDDAKAYYKRRAEYLTKNIQNLQATMSEKQKQYGMVCEVMQAKIMMEQQKQAQESS
ncbi:MAG: hypothetical protein SGCHY_003894 [Lobulomycetales sp.]